MTYYFTVELKPALYDPGNFVFEIFGFSSDPQMAMFELQRKVAADDPDSPTISNHCILYQSLYIPPTNENIEKFIPGARPIDNCGIFALGVKSQDKCFFLDTTAHKEYSIMLTHDTQLLGDEVSMLVRNTWAKAFANDNGLLQKLLGNPRNDQSNKQDLSKGGRKR